MNIIEIENLTYSYPAAKNRDREFDLFLSRRKKSDSEEHIAYG